MRRPRLWLLGAIVATAGCSVQLRDDKAELPAANNLCTTDASCGRGAACISGACFFRTGAIDEVLLEVLPDSSSSSGGLSFLTVQEHVASGDNARDLEVPVPKRIDGQVEISATALPDNGHCDYLAVGDQPIRIAARVEFARVGAIGGVQVLSLPKTSVMVDTDHGTSPTGSWTFSTYLVPGTYDIYVQPVSTAKCPIPPAILRGIEVTDKSPAWGLPATIDLPASKHLRGTVERRGGTLVGWQVEVIEPQERRVISTSAVLGPTNGPTASTNFVVDYQPWVSTPSSKTGIAQTTGEGPLIRLTPPLEMAGHAPTVYWDLATIDLDGNGVVSLDLSGLPPPEQQIVVTGQVRGENGATSNVRSSVQFLSTSLDGGLGLTANFSQSVATDDAGNFEARLFPGQYRVVAVPDAANAGDAPGLVASQGSSQPMSNTHPWAITERQWTATPDSSRLDLELFPKRVLEGNAWAGTGSPALGAQLEAVPTIIPSQLGVLKGALGQTPVLPQSASVMVSETDAHFAVALDPGAFDISLRPAQGSNFAWWVWPAASITPPESAGQSTTIAPQLQLPVPLEGTIRDPGSSSVLANAIVRAYAKSPTGGGVVKVGEARTDGAGHYALRLPAHFGP